MILLVFFFFFKQKTAYEMRISDWSSDVCSSDLRVIRNHRQAAYGATSGYEALSIAPVPLDAANCPDRALVDAARRAWDQALALGEQHGYRNAQATVKIGRASCRERVCQYV